ncbi:sugar ABC transporter substrate-binding protein [Lederbergia sp. NSJ-179]|uniref:ABC transporter substrate-binding protein n=1 Tax=Lederbergia sp. NSJ-179 TaxID=2931402 RepID=UPI001FD39691|nr:sugar ABC transporter substrate-binding protein [Lederbergia sp. NSJ-179]MCJ7840695.1 sugar ABC transporter substrate-binding protein [Lederbergia sp. NSJ-179]
MRKTMIFASMIMIFALIGILTGCNNDSSSSNEGEPASKEKSVEITVGAEAGGPYTEFYKGIVDDFTKGTGIKVNFLEIPHDNMHQRFLTESMSGGGAIDVYQTDQPWISEFASNGFLEPLSSKISDEDKKDFAPAALETVKYKDEIYGLPYLVHTPIVYYRTDLFEEAGLKGPPKTWEEYRTYAQKLNNPDKEIYGTLIEGKQAGEPVTHLLDLVHQGGGGILDENDEVILDSPEVKSVFEYLNAIQNEDKTSPPGAVGFDNAEAQNMFLQGKVAMVKNWPYMYSTANDPEDSRVADNFAIAKQPKGDLSGSAIWSWGYGVSSSSENKDAAWKFVQWATSSEVVKQLGKEFINPVPRESALNALKEDDSVSKKDLEAVTIMSESLKDGQVFTQNPNFPSIQERLSVTLSKLLSKQTSIEEELDATSQDVKDILAE